MKHNYHNKVKYRILKTRVVDYYYRKEGSVEIRINGIILLKEYLMSYIFIFVFSKLMFLMS